MLSRTEFWLLSQSFQDLACHQKRLCVYTAAKAFDGTNVNVTSEGRPYLGSPLGSDDYTSQFVSEKVLKWATELKLLSTIVSTQPHAAYSALTHGLSSKWTYLSRTTPDIGHHLQLLEDIIRSDLIPNITSRPPPCDSMRNLFALPARNGGLGIPNPVSQAESEYAASLLITAPLKKLILSKDGVYSVSALQDQLAAKAQIKKERLERSKATAISLKPSLSASIKRALILAEEKGASSWLTTLPIEEHGFSLHKGAFSDALALWYGWTPSRSPTNCECGSSFSVEHALSCNKGGFPSLRHNEIRDLTAQLLTEVCNDVRVEPVLQTLTGEVFTSRSTNTTDGARLDIAANGFWGGRSEKCFFDVRVFNPHAPSNSQIPLDKCFKKHEMEKRRNYSQRIQHVEHASFTPLVLSASGGMAKEATVFYKSFYT